MQKDTLRGRCTCTLFSLGAAAWLGACAPATTSAPATAVTSVAAVAPEAAAAATGAAASVVAAAKKPVADTYHGVSVSDDYRWLEQLDSPETQAFVAAQNALAQKALAELPGREAVRARLKEIMGSSVISYLEPEFVGGTLYALKTQPPRQQPLLVAMPGPDGADRERPVVDVIAMDASGHTTIDWYRVSPDGKYLAASISSGGSEAGDAHVFDTATGKEVFEVVPRVNGGTAGGDLAWAPDSKGFYYSRYPRGDERPAADKMFYTQVYYHALGTPTDKDRYEIGRDFPRIAEIRLFGNPAPDANGEILAAVQKGDGGEFMHFLRDRAGAWKQLTTWEDRVVHAAFGERGELLLLSRKDAPRGKLLRAPRKGFDLAKATVLVPEQGDAIPFVFADAPPVVAHGGRIYVEYQLGGPSEVRVFDAAGKPQPGPSLLPVSSADNVVPLDGKSVLIRNASFTSPRQWVRFDPGAPAKKESKKTSISTKSPLDLSGVTVLRELATSKDGTKVPVNILLPMGVAKGTAIPFAVTGYGGYGVNQSPQFQMSRAVLLEHGVGLAICNLRGGGEFGDAWHTAGNLTRKQNVFDDFAGSIEHLIKAKYALPDRIGIFGGSNGGLLMGALLTQRPELPRAVVSFVGIYDMLRVETDANGSFNTTEFGTVKDEAQFRALYGYSPYHHVKDGQAYPALMLLTGANDTRVAPWQSHKMAARMQAASPSGVVLERVESAAGHGMGSAVDVLVAEYADAWSFLLHHLGVDGANAPGK